ncbi:MAG: peptidoglycan recognition protein family protein [Planctomycetes bacterium]|nr:peptidoglycan recognition protein family protein [Planctomycetota bacterium]
MSCLAVVAAGLASGCASTEGEAAPDDEAGVLNAPGAVAIDISCPQLARELGLRFSTVAGTDRVALESPNGSRILLFPGTLVASVAGRQLQLSQEPYRRGTELWLVGKDANSVRATWNAQSAFGANLPPAVADAYRVPIPDRPAAGGSAPAGVQRPIASPAASGDNRPTAAEVSAWSVPLRRKWQYLVVHHSASAAGNAAAIDRWHKDRGFDGLGYDFVIGNGTGSTDGSVEVGYRWKQQLIGAHAKTAANFMNEHGIGVCLVGDFTRTRPTAAQLRSLDRLCTFLAQYCGIPAENLRMHGEVKSTECPGKYFPRDFAIRTPVGASRAAAVNDGSDSGGTK